MATIDLGRLGFVNKGTYNNSTTYEKNDLVQFTDGGLLSTYLYIDSTAQSGQAPSSSGTAGSRWVYFAKGGAAGTDVAATLANKEISFKTNAGALDGVPIGSAGEFLKVNSGATGYEFGAVSSDFVKIATQALDSTGLASFEFQNCFSASNDALYGGYHLQMYYQNNGATNGVNVRFLTGTNTELSGSTDYRHGGIEGYIQTNGSNNSHGNMNDGDGKNTMDWDNWGVNSSNNSTEGAYFSASLQGAMYGGTGQNKSVIVQCSLRDNSSPNYIVGKYVAYRTDTTLNITGLKFFLGSGAISNGQCTLWGLKK